MDIEEKRSSRFIFMNRLYELTDGDENSVIMAFDIGKENGWSDEYTLRIVQYLDGEGLLKERTVGVGVCITHYGVVQVENAHSNPNSATEYFPPVANIIIIGQAINSPIQQASPSSVQTVSVVPNDAAIIKDLTSALMAELDKLNLSDNVKADLRAEINTAEAQLTSSKPKKSIIKESLASISEMLRSAAVNATVSMFIEKISNVMAQL